jgi:signal transduction histidine kinase/DNA-binding response OmpR family regulator
MSLKIRHLPGPKYLGTGRGAGFFILLIAIAVIIFVFGFAIGAVFFISGTDGEGAFKNIGSILLIVIMALFLGITALIAVILLKYPAHSQNTQTESMSMSKYAFLAKMSHEIRTPMNTIIGFSELALDSENSLKTRDYLGKIQANAEWLLQIINGILDISKIESGGMELENIPFDLHELFTSCKTLIMPLAIEKGLQLYFYVEPSLGKRPLGDPSKLRQVLVNMLTNAVKFTNIGMIKLHAVLKNMSDDKITMYFEVKDSGVGMTPEQIKKILDPFAQTETGEPISEGTGLGLSISKTIVELMGGKLSIESSPGIGSKFSFELVFDSIDFSGDEMFEKKVHIDEYKKPSFEGEVLICEDNPMNQQVIGSHLTRVGLKIVSAENGKIGLDLVKSRKEKGEKQFDLIFMDIHMPVMDGLEAAAKIIELGTNVPIVAITANVMPNDREIYKTSGIHDCVGKPFTSQELWRCLMKYFTPLTTSDGQKNALLEAEIQSQKDLQSMFVENYKTVYPEIIKALEESNIKLAHRLVHTLKGNAGQIGKTLLCRAAASIESQLKDGKNRVTEEQLRILETELDAVLNEFSR